MRSLKIVVADDEPAVRAVLAAWLTKLGHVVVAVGDGAELVAVCRRCSYDLAVSDVRMPNLDGLAAAGVLRRECGLPVILLSDAWTAEQQAQARSVGAFCLGKPVQPLALVAMVEEPGRRAKATPAGV